MNNFRGVVLVAGMMLAMQADGETDVPMSAADQSAARAREALLLSVAESSDLAGLRIQIIESQLLAREFVAGPTDASLTERWRALQARTLVDGADDPMVQAAILNARASDYPGADRAHAIAVLTAASRDNGYYGLPVLGVPTVRQDAKATQRLVHAMAGATTFRSPFTEMLRAFDAAAAPLDWRVAVPASMAGTDAPELSYRVQGIALLAAMGMSGLQPLYAVCEHAQGGLRADCLTIAQHWFADGDTLIDRTFAASLWLRACDSESECALVRAERRKLDWLQKRAMDVLIPAETAMSPTLTHYLERMDTVGEIAAMRELVVAQGIDLEPPADWESSNEAADRAAAARPARD